MMTNFPGAAAVGLSLIILFLAAYYKFNSPPTNRAGTTYFLFLFGYTIYFLLLFTLWLIGTAMLRHGGLELYALADLNSNDIVWLPPLLAALLMLLGGWKFKWIQRADGRARKVCLHLAAIPSAANSLGVQLATLTAFDTSEAKMDKYLRPELVRRGIVSDRVFADTLTGPISVAVEAFRRAVILRQQLVASAKKRLDQSDVGANEGDTALTRRYKRYLGHHQEQIQRSRSAYDELMAFADKFFASPRFQEEKAQDLRLRSEQMFQLDSRLLAGAVLECEITEKQRNRKLAEFGFETYFSGPGIDQNQIAAMTVMVMIVFACVQLVLPLKNMPPGGKFFIPIMLGLSLGIAILLGTTVAYRHWDRGSDAFPPVFAALIAGILAICGSFGVRALFAGASVLVGHGACPFPNGHQLGLVQCVEQQWPFTLFPFIATTMIAVVCTIRPLQHMRARWLILPGGLLLAAGLEIAALIVRTLRPMPGTTLKILFVPAVVGFIVGAMVLPAFRLTLYAKTEQTE